MEGNRTPQVNLSDPPRSGVTGNKSRHVATLSNVPLIGRTAFASRLQQVATAAATPGANYPNLIAFLKFWKWVIPYLRDCFRRKARYRTYPVGKSGIFPVAVRAEEGPLRIGVAADWGTGTLESEKVAENIKAGSPHFTLHLGDVYYMGEACEIEENCLGKPTPRYAGVDWPPRLARKFCPDGEPRNVFRRAGYYQTFLKTLGLLNAGSVKDPQSASYFCLDTGHWLVLGLDTGYHSGGMPAFTAIPLVNRIPFLDVDARFDDKMMGWLQETMNKTQADGSKKPVLLLTHHQPISSFEHAFRKPAKQLAQSGLFDGQELVWLYGHEHRLTVYNECEIANTLRVFPRCIGHGGMPVSVTVVRRPKPEILYYDPRQHAIDDENPDTKVGYNGHVVLVFDGARLTIEYHDILNNNTLLTRHSFRTLQNLARSNTPPRSRPAARCRVDVNWSGPGVGQLQPKKWQHATISGNRMGTEPIPRRFKGFQKRPG